MEPDEPSVEQRELLASYQQATAPDDDAVERALARLTIRLESEPPVHAPIDRRVWLAAAALLLVILGGAALVVAVGLGDSRQVGRHEAEYQRVPAPPLESTSHGPRDQPERRGSAAVVEPASETPPAPELEPASEPRVEPSLESPQRPRTPSVEHETASPEKAEPETETAEPALAPQPASDLADESHLLAKARRALTKHDWAGALEWAREHARRHPEGLLVEERLVIEAVAACHAGERERGLDSLAEAERRFGPPAAKPEIEAACAPD